MPLEEWHAATETYLVLCSEGRKQGLPQALALMDADGIYVKVLVVCFPLVWHKVIPDLRQR